MNSRLVGTLQKLFWIFGWILLASTAVYIAVTAYQQIAPPVSALILMPKPAFSFLSSARSALSTNAEAFFAFLMSAVLAMTLKPNPARAAQSEIFLRATCLSFCGEGVLRLIGWAQSVTYTLQQRDSFAKLELFNGLLYLSHLFSCFVPFLYAVAIYVLYSRFYQMVSFESEVI